MIDRNGKLLLQIKRIMNSSTSHNIEQIGYHGYVNTEIEQLILESFKVENLFMNNWKLQ